MAVKAKISQLCLLFLVASLDSVWGDCNVCSAVTNIACVSQTQFEVCVNALPTGEAFSCPENYVCTTASPYICQPNEAGVITTCNDCMKCDATGAFACTGARTYALCLGNTVPSNLAGTCAPNYYCNIDYPQICGAANQGILPTCSILDDVTTTVAPPNSTPPSPITDPTGYCQAVKQDGRFPVGNNINTTCRQYVHCLVSGGIWIGALYKCASNTYFNSSTRLCGPTVPSNCNVNAQSLMFARSLLLIDES